MKFFLLVTEVLFRYDIMVGPLVSVTGVPFRYNVTVGLVLTIIPSNYCTVSNRDSAHSFVSNFRIISGFSKGSPC